MGGAARPLHDPGNHRSVERGSNLQAARRGGLMKPAKPAGERENTAALTPSLGTRSPPAASQWRLLGVKSRFKAALERRCWPINLRDKRVGALEAAGAPAGRAAAARGLLRPLHSDFTLCQTVWRRTAR